MKLNDLIALIRSGRAGRERATKFLYHDQGLNNGIKRIIRVGGGNENDFQEIFNFTLVQFLKAVMEKKDLVIKTNVNSYLFGIARNLWLQELRKRKKLPQSLPEDFVAVDATPPIDLVIMNDEKNRMLSKVLDHMGKKCKEVLMLWAANYRMREIAADLKYKSEDVVRKKKFLCMKELAKFLAAHPAVKKILTE